MFAVSVNVIVLLLTSNFAKTKLKKDFSLIHITNETYEETIISLQINSNE